MLIKKYFQKMQGSLLLEALLVIVILSVGLTFIIQSLSSSLRALSFSKSYAQAAFLIDHKLSEILLKKSTVSNFQESGNFESPFNEFRYQVSTAPVNLLADESNPNTLNQVNLTVSWQSGKNTREVSALLCLLKSSADEGINIP